MNLLTDLANGPTKLANNNRLERWYKNLPQEEQTIVLNAVRNPDWRHTELYEVLHANGCPKVSDNVFGKWRKGKANESQ